jgi:crotonobetainyl-CoA:carnitine CoA-transferase CaiB-like acyl-CoA transferase
VYELQAAQVPPAGPRFTYGPVRASDGDFIVTPITHRNFTAMCEAIGRPELKSDERFASVAARSRNWNELMANVGAWAKTRRVAECLKALEAAGVPATDYRDPADALTDPQLLARGTFVKVSDGVGEFTGVNPPYRLSASKADLHSLVPEAGGQTEDVLRELLGLDAHALRQAREHGAFGT